MSLSGIVKILVVLAAAAYSQSINLRGKVTDAGNKAITGAKVELVKAKQSATTGADGAFSITATVGALNHRKLQESAFIGFEAGILNLIVPTESRVRVEIFDAHGTLLDQQAWNQAAKGTYRIDLGNKIKSDQMLIVRASIGGMTQSFPFLKSVRGQDANASVSLAAPAALSKVSAVVDTLKVSADGFTAKSVSITSYDSTVNVTLEATGGDRWGGLKNVAVKSAGCGKAAGITNGKKTIQSTGQSRSYTIDIPTGYDMNKAYKFFYCSHWISSNAEAVVGQNYYWLKDQATSAGEQAIFLAPQALPGNPNGTWATGPYISSNPNDSIDNVLFTDILKFVKDNLCIDETRVFATGFSFGGMMTYSLSENRQNLIRAAVGIAPANWNIYVPPKKHEPIAWMQTTGMSDGTCPWICTSGQCNSQKDGAKFAAIGHAQDNGCTIPTDIPTSNSGAHLCYDFTGCKAGYPVKACTFAGGHTNDQKDPGSNVNWIPVESWKFFSQF